MESTEQVVGGNLAETFPLDSQFRLYMNQIEEMLTTTSTEQQSLPKNALISPKKNLIPAARKPPLDLSDQDPQNESVPDFLTNLVTSSHSAERTNVKRFLKEFDRLKNEIKKLTGQNSLLTKNKTFLEGRNVFLEKSNGDLLRKLTAVEEEVTSLRQSREDLLQKTHLIHEKDRWHYRQSFQKVLQNMDAEKMKDFKKVVRKQNQLFESRISELQTANEELSNERSMTKQKLQDLQQKLTAAELASAIGSADHSHNASEMELRFLAVNFELQQTKTKLEMTEKNYQKLNVQINILQERNKIIMKEHEMLKKENNDEIFRLKTMFNKKNTQLENFQKLSENEMKNFQLNLARDTAVAEKHNIILQLSQKLTETEETLKKKVEEEEEETAALSAEIRRLTAELRAEKQILERVKKTRDELFEIVAADERFRNELDSKQSDSNLYAGNGTRRAEDVLNRRMQVQRLE